jgi:hypothetical protein
MNEQYRRTLVLAVKMLRVGAACNVFFSTEAQLNQWMRGAQAVPERILVHAVDVILEDPVGAARTAAELVAEGARIDRIH